MFVPGTTPRQNISSQGRGERRESRRTATWNSFHVVIHCAVEEREDGWTSRPRREVSVGTSHRKKHSSPTNVELWGCAGDVLADSNSCHRSCHTWVVLGDWDSVTSRNAAKPQEVMIDTLFVARLVTLQSPSTLPIFGQALYRFVDDVDDTISP